MWDLIITVCITVGLYSMLLEFLEKRNIRKIEKEMKGRLDIVIKESSKEKKLNKQKMLVIDFYDAYKEIDFKKKGRGLQLELVRLLFAYVIAVLQMGNSNDQLSVTFDNDEVDEVCRKLSVSSNKKEQLELILKNLFAYIKQQDDE